MELDVIYMRRTKGEEAVQIYLSMDHDLIVQEYLCPPPSLTHAGHMQRGWLLYFMHVHICLEMR